MTHGWQPGRRVGATWPRADSSWARVLQLYPWGPADSYKLANLAHCVCSNVRYPRWPVAPAGHISIAQQVLSQPHDCFPAAQNICQKAAAVREGCRQHLLAPQASLISSAMYLAVCSSPAAAPHQLPTAPLAVWPPAAAEKASTFGSGLLLASLQPSSSAASTSDCPGGATAAHSSR